MSVNISCDLGDLSHHNNHSHQIHHGINVQNQFLLEKIPKINKWVPGGHLAPWNLTSHDIWHFMSIDISCRLTLHVGWHYMSVDMIHVSCVICHVSYHPFHWCHLMSCHLTFCVIPHFVTFCVIWHFVSFDISCDHYCNHSHQSHHGIYAQVVVEDRCVLKKWVPCG